MIVFLFRPSPQVPRPSTRAAKQCFAASSYLIYVQRDQIVRKSVDLTWIFTQSIFMSINTILWTLSYYEIRQEHSKEEVEKDLNVAMDCIAKAIERWPGVASAHQLYRNLIAACLKIYEKDGDIPIAVGSPESTVDPSRSRTTSPSFAPPAPATQLTQPLNSTPTEPKMAFGYFINEQPSAIRADSFHPSPTHDVKMVAPQATSAVQIPQTNGMGSPSTLGNPSQGGANRTDSNTSYGGMSSISFDSNFDPNSQFNPLPNTFHDLAVNWNPTFTLSSGQGAPNIPALSPYDQPLFGMDPLHSNVPLSDYLYPPSWNLDASRGAGLTQQQQSELMHTLQEEGPSQINPMIQASNAFFYPQGRSF